jgi:hypothetical protein
MMALLVVAPAVLSAQNPPPASQNPSPMVEFSRAHERIAEYQPPGHRDTLVGPLGKPVYVFIPASARKASSVRLVLHFHGSEFLPEHAVVRAGTNYISAVVQLGAGSGIYDANFSNPAAFDSLLASIRASVRKVVGSTPIRGIILSGFSAGHGAIRAILRDSAHFAAVAAVLLLDGMHTAYEPPGTVIALGGRLDPAKLHEFLAFARAAADGDKRFLITHSEIFPGTFASTTETANYLLDALQLKRRSVLAWGPLGMQQTSAARQGRFHVLGFAGNAGPDHIDHFHAMYHFLRLLERL